MLTHLHIRDFAIIDSVELEFGPGMTVLTGETGAGKSIVVDALTLVAGARAGADVVRAGAERAEIAASFDLGRASAELRERLQALDIPAEDDELLVRRVVTPDGRSRAWLGGQPVPLQQLRDVVGELVDVHGQHEFQSLVRPAMQRDLLDQYGRLAAARSAVRTAWRSWAEEQRALREVEALAGDREARLEFLRFQVNELDALAPVEGEYSALSAEGQRLTHRGRLVEAAQGASQMLYEDDQAAHRAIAQAAQLLRPLVALDAALQSPLALLDDAAVQVAEAARSLQRYADGLDLDPGRQAEVERRLAAIESLARKHRIGADELPARHEALRNELAALERADHDAGHLRARLAAALVLYREAAQTLSAARQAAATRLGKDIAQRMQGLGMAGGRFAVQVVA
jgi:DNA repair protein RecN (Recombination protein N)